MTLSAKTMQASVGTDRTPSHGGTCSTNKIKHIPQKSFSCDGEF